jgi:hypothetical protein
VRRAQRERRILATEEPAFIARHLFFVYSAAIRWWIAAPKPEVKQGLADLRRLLELQFSGLSPAPVPEDGTKRRPGSKPTRKAVSA